VFSQQLVDSSHGIHVNDTTFPWELVIDRGKILGCVYDNKFYSVGSILILESLPRKCGQDSDRSGIWQQLSETELALFKESLEAQQQLEREATLIGNKPITKEEARVIRYLRHMKTVIQNKED
jgi:hypothetical protein